MAYHIMANNTFPVQDGTPVFITRQEFLRCCCIPLWLIYRIKWDTGDGKDLAEYFVYTTLIPAVSGSVGRCASADSGPIHWGGDGVGIEAAYVELNYESIVDRSTIAVYPETWWWTGATDKFVNLEAELYEGGVVTASGNDWVCTGTLLDSEYRSNVTVLATHNYCRSQGLDPSAGIVYFYRDTKTITLST